MSTHRPSVEPQLERVRAGVRFRRLGSRLGVCAAIIGIASCCHLVVASAADDAGKSQVLAVAGAPNGTAAEMASPATTLPAATFEADVQPLLSRYGCNAGACHGKARGQNGFALSLLGFDHDFDYAALVHAGRARRVSLATPENSLLLLKATGRVPHGGGKRFEVDGPQFQVINRWIQAGCPRTPADAPQLVRVSVEPTHQTLAPGESFSLRTMAIFSDGSQREVSELAAYQSGDMTVAATPPDQHGQVAAGALPGEATVMARYMNHIAVCSVTIPLANAPSDDAYRALPRVNEIDGLVWEKLQLLGLFPSTPASETTFHRRAYLRVIGRLPTPQETRAYLADTRTDKRQRLVDQLLDRPEYADFWANKWADLLRPNPFDTGVKTVWNLNDWLRNAFRQNMPYDQFVRELVTAKGSTFRNGATVILRDRRYPMEIGPAISQIFLGVRLDCAKCHHHPFEAWSQDDFRGFAALFAKVGHIGGVSPPISGEEELIYLQPAGELKDERNGATVVPRVLHGEPLHIPPDVDPRDLLVEWMLEPSNPYFARVMANRVWAEIMGQGLVTPLDDLRTTNPASNEPLLDYLADDFRQQGYDIKKLIRKIMTSHVFGLSSEPSERNVSDYKNFSRYYRQRIRAEVLLDGINDVLGYQDEFTNVAFGSRAMELWTYRTASDFLDTFGRPDMNLEPPCERTPDTTTPQILHLMNSQQIDHKLTRDEGRPAQLANGEMTNAQIVEEAYLLVYNRLPAPDEARVVLAAMPPEKDQRRQAVEDLFWSLLSTPEYLFVD